MNRYKIICSLLFLLTANALWAQQYLDQTSTWGLFRSSLQMTGLYETYATITIDGDTTIQGKTYYKLYREGVDSITLSGTTTTYGVPLPRTLYGLIREDSAKLYAYYLNTGQESLLYDFTRAVGDTVSEGPCTDTVVNIDTVYLGAIPLKRWNFNPSSGMLPYIEGVGSITGLFGFRCMFVGMGGSSLVCYSRNGDELQVDPNKSCSIYTSTAVLETKALEAQIYPNPTLGKVTIELPVLEEASYQLFNINGQLVEEQSINNHQEELDLSNYPKGMYNLRLQSGKQTLIQKLIKI